MNSCVEFFLTIHIEKMLKMDKNRDKHIIIKFRLLKYPRINICVHFQIQLHKSLSITTLCHKDNIVDRTNDECFI